MNTISNQRILKSRISKGWAHDSAQFSFYRKTPANQARIPFEEQPVRGTEVALWAAAFVFIAVVLFFVLGLV